MSSLVDFRGTLYGTTASGGNYSISGGTVYSFTTSGAEQVIHDFGPSKDGQGPASEPVAANGVFYGTTPYGGKYGSGVAYSLAPSGEEHVIHNFGKVPDGKSPATGLTVFNGTLYGTTQGGGRHNGGTVFAISASGKEHVVHNFGKTFKDGRDPTGALIVVKGVLYGTTSSGCGTVFSLTTNGEEKTLHTFNCRYGDGGSPDGALIAVKDTLYGVTFLGGDQYQSGADGTVYSVTTSGKERVLHTFGEGNDGKEPEGALVLFNGKLYGVTYGGGRYYDGGTVFSITTTGTEQILYSFGGSADDGKVP
ncbi:MAG TPA: choice-of-anchor tandem repeat GloVer-containing protein, partial [Candidatus Cybelea sp.]